MFINKNSKLIKWSSNWIYSVCVI